MPPMQRDVRLNPSQPGPINAYGLKYGPQLTTEQLLLPWKVERNQLPYDQDEAVECTVAIKGVPDEADSNEFEPILTLFDQLPHGHHELLAINIPMSGYTGNHRGMIFLRWCNKEWANRAVSIINSRAVNFKSGPRKLYAEISRTPCVVNLQRGLNQMPILGGVFQFQMVWKVLKEAVHPGNGGNVSV